MTIAIDRQGIGATSREHVRSESKGLLTRRWLRYVLGLLWVLDGALQLQSFMFTRGFAHQIIAPAAAGQPWFVSGPVRWNASLIAHQPVLFDAAFAGIQLAIGVGLLIPRTCRIAIIGSVLWAGGVWYFGEGMGELAGGHATALIGAPGAALLYIVLAAAAWPETDRSHAARSDGNAGRVPHWLAYVWASLWAGAAVLDLLPGNRPASAFPAQLYSNASSVPGWLATIDRWLGSGIHALGGSATPLVVGIELAIGLGSLGRRPIRTVAIGSGIVLAAVYWAAGQSFGMLFSGQATDPNAGPLVMIIGVAALGATTRRQGSGRHAAEGVGTDVSGGRSEIRVTPAR